MYMNNICASICKICIYVNMYMYVNVNIYIYIYIYIYINFGCYDKMSINIYVKNKSIVILRV